MQVPSPGRAIVTINPPDDNKWREELSFKCEQLALRRADLEMEQERPTKILRVAEQYCNRKGVCRLDVH